MTKFFTLIGFCVTVVGCTPSDKIEYFCEGYNKISKHTLEISDVSYSQAPLQVSKTEFCVQWIPGEFQCVKLGHEVKGAWTLDENKFTETQYKYESRLVDGSYLFFVSKLERPAPGVNVERTQTSEGWKFAFKEMELGLLLPKKYASEDNFRTFDLYAIANVAYYNGKMMRFSLDGEKSFGIGGAAYRSWYARANNEVTYIYKFSPSKNVLVTSSPDDDNAPSYSYQCTIWKKQKWWEL